MEYVKLGKTNIKVSKIGIGTWQWGSKGWGYGVEYTFDDLKEAFNHALDNGLNFFDTAEFYGGGKSEEILGELSNDRRDEVILATKVWPTHLSYKGVKRTFEKCANRLKTDYIDLLYVHWPNPVIPLSSTARAFNELYEDGKIKAIGVSNFKLGKMKKFDELVNGKLSANQVKYSLLHRVVERDLLPYCLENDITLVAYSPLDQGAITGRYDENNLPKDRWRRLNSLFTKTNMRKIKPIIELLLDLASNYDVEPVNIALKYLILKGAVPIVGVKRKSHVESLLKTFEFELKQNDFKKIEDELNKIKVSKIKAIPGMLIRFIKG